MDGHDVIYRLRYSQILKTAKTQTVDGLSFRLLSFSFMANIDALCYAIRIHQRPLQIKYALALVFLSVCIGLYARVYFQEEERR